MKLLQLIFDRLRPNVIIVATLVTWITLDFGDKMILLLADVTDLTAESIITILATLIGVAIGGLIAAMVRMFEQANVPADSHERIIERILDRTVEKVGNDSS